MRLAGWILLSLTSLGMVACGGGSGSGSDASSPPTTSNPPSVPNTAPIAAVLAAGQVGAGGPTADLSTSVGANVSLSGATSTDADGDVLTFHWALTGKPSDSQLILTSDASVLEFTPDALGTYVFVLRVTDSRGAFSEKSVTILASNTAPNPTVLIDATYTAEPIVQPTREITIGATVVLDASNSADPDGDAITTTWSLTQKPTSSAAALIITGQTARFTADQPGIYKVTARGQDPMGASAETTYVLDAQNHAPAAILVASALPVIRNSGQNLLQAALGYDILLDSSSSSDADGDTLTRTWALTSKPLSSTAQLSATTGNSIGLTPDVLGNYVVQLTVADAAGASATYTTTITVNNRRPLAAIAANASPVALPSAPSIRVPVNTLLTLRGSGSTDADGDALTYAWAVMSAPPGSRASLVTPTAVNTEFTPDVDGSYVVRLRVTDPSGAFSQRTLTIAIGNYPPVAVVSKSNVTVVVGTTVSVSAALSYDEDGDSLSYSWTLDARPSASGAVVTSPAAAAITLTPDVPGAYVAAITVSDGGSSNVGYVTVRAVPALTASVALPFTPGIAKYSRGLDQLVVAATSPDALEIVDPFTGVIKTVVLPFAVTSLQLSPNGKLAAALHDGRVSLIDLESSSLVRTSFTGGATTDVYLQDDGVAYLVGGNQFVSPPVTILDLQSGMTLPSSGYVGGGARFYGIQKGVFADRLNKVFQISGGLSPADIDVFTIDPVQHIVLSSGDSPYHGDYPIGGDFYLSEDQSRLFTSAGTFFDTGTLTYGGTLSGGFISLSQSAQNDEVVTLNYDYSPMLGQTYSSVYKRFDGSLLQPDADLPLPVIGGQQSYGLKIFHSANANHVVLVQTGSASTAATGLSYYVIVR